MLAVPVQFNCIFLSAIEGLQGNLICSPEFSLWLQSITDDKAFVSSCENYFDTALNITLLMFIYFNLFFYFTQYSRLAHS